MDSSSPRARSELPALDGLSCLFKLTVLQSEVRAIDLNRRRYLAQAALQMPRGFLQTTFCRPNLGCCPHVFTVEFLTLENPFPSAQEITLTFDGAVARLEIAHVDVENAGEICCVFVNEVGSTETSARLTVEGARTHTHARTLTHTHTQGKEFLLYL